MSAMDMLSSIAENRTYWQFLALGNIPQNSFILEHRKNDKVVDRWMETPLTLAARFGFDELVLRILEICPTAAMSRGKEGKNLLHVAVENRQEMILKELIKIGKVDPRLPLRLKSAKDFNGNTILHLAAMANSKSSSPMQMLEEFRWFERVKTILPRDLVNHRNKDEKTAEELFTESHASMVEDAKKQLTDTARACCGALVSAVSFAAGFSIINDMDKKRSDADHQTKVVLKVFSHIYMFGLSCTAVALLQFMALLMASYKEEDFRMSLPTQYVLAFATLFTAMFAMLVAFACNTYVNLHKDLNSNWRSYLWLALEILVVPLICLVVLRCRSVRFPFLSTVRAFFR
ncbi:Ankyrin repeat [Macleaya cordata]|uniref:Ankyrin repeat n=1 Tax=Macleaya cordata TaxID=56857 RepID=A0A200RCK2_MACCD|nr:Ankyrin repeat [Macleaya cordata]